MCSGEFIHGESHEGVAIGVSGKIVEVEGDGDVAAGLELAVDGKRRAGVEVDVSDVACAAFGDVSGDAALSGEEEGDIGVGEDEVAAVGGDDASLEPCLAGDGDAGCAEDVAGESASASGDSDAVDGGGITGEHGAAGDINVAALGCGVVGMDAVDVSGETRAALKSQNAVIDGVSGDGGVGALETEVGVRANLDVCGIGCGC